jgi:hypothetical protein
MRPLDVGTELKETLLRSLLKEKAAYSASAALKSRACAGPTVKKNPAPRAETKAESVSLDAEVDNETTKFTQLSFCLSLLEALGRSCRTSGTQRAEQQHGLQRQMACACALLLHVHPALAYEPGWP